MLHPGSHATREPGAGSETLNEEPTVFVVDNDAKTRDVLRTLAASAGFAAEAYADAETFLRTLEPTRVGCLVLDARLPGMSGLELQKALLVREVSLPVIVTTGYGDVRVATDAMRAGAFDVIEKPFLGERLVESIRQAIALHRHVRTGENESQEVRRRCARLTAREHEVLDLVVSGMTSKAIAAQLGLREKTIEVYRSRIKGTMQARNAADLVRLMARISGEHT